MFGQSLQKTVVWALIAAFLNLLLSAAPAGTVSAQSHSKLRLTVDQLSYQTSASSCQTDTSLAPQLDPTRQIDCRGSSCDEGCSFCFQIGAVIPIDLEPAVIPEREAFDSGDLSRLTDPGCQVITPPPKPLFS